MELWRCRHSDLSSKWAALQFPNLRSLGVTDDLTMEKQAFRVIYYVFIVNTYSEVALYEELVHCLHYRSHACRVVLSLHTQQSGWRCCCTITANRYFFSIVQFPPLIFISLIVYLFCTFLYTFVFSQLFVCFPWCICIFFLVSFILFFIIFLSFPGPVLQLIVFVLGSFYFTLDYLFLSVYYLFLYSFFSSDFKFFLTVFCTSFLCFLH